MNGLLVALASSAMAVSLPQGQQASLDSLAMTAHWKCKVWSEMAGDPEAAQEHYEKGYASGRRFVSAVRAGDVELSEINSAVPMMVALTLQGPSDEFVLGRLYELLTTYAHDQVSIRDADGVLVEPTRYVLDPEQQALKAQGFLSSSNCTALRG